MALCRLPINSDAGPRRLPIFQAIFTFIVPKDTVALACLQPSCFFSLVIHNRPKPRYNSSNQNAHLFVSVVSKRLH